MHQVAFIYKITDLTLTYFAITVWKTRPQTFRQFWLHLLCFYPYETTVVFCYTAPPPNIDLNRRNWRENSGFLLAEIRLGFSPTPLSFLVAVASGSRGMSPFFFLRADAVLELWLVKIFRLCWAILLNETSLTTQEARWLFAVCLGVAKSLFFLTLL